MEIAEMYVTGFSQATIAKQTGKSVKVIRRALKNAGVEIRKPYEHKQTILSEEIQQKIVERYSCETIREIAASLDLPRSTVKSAVGTLLRSKGEAAAFGAQRKAAVLSERQIQLVLGSLLGDSSLSWHRTRGPRTENFNYMLSCSHGAKQLGYLEHKRELLGAPRCFKQFGGPTSKSPGRLYYSMKYQNKSGLQEIARLVLVGRKKRVTREWLNRIGPEGMAYWYMDDGSLTKANGRITVWFATNSFDEEEIRLIQSWLSELGYRNWTVRAKTGKTIRLAKPASVRFLDTVQSTVSSIPCMRYKLLNSNSLPVREDGNQPA